MHFPSTLALAALTSTSLALTIPKRGDAPADADCTNWVTVTSTVTRGGAPTGAPPAQGAAVAEPTPDTVPDATYDERVDNSDGQSGGDSSPSQGSGNGGGSDYSPPENKRGFAYNDANLVNQLLKGGAKGSWAYNWGSNDNGLDSSIEFVPMLWGEKTLDTWDADAKDMIAKGAKNLLSFNEPDHAEQAKIDPESAADLHVKKMNPYSDNGKVRIGSPGVTNSEKPGEGTQWLESFMKACETKGCQVDFCVAHWYAPSNAEQSLKDHLDEVRRICGDDRPVWLTEFAPNDDTGSADFIKSAMGMLDDIDWLERYSYFMVGGEGKLTEGSGGLSAEGQAYFEG